MAAPKHASQYFFARVLELHDTVIVEETDCSDSKIIELLAIRGLLRELAERRREQSGPKLVRLPSSRKSGAA